MNDFYRRTIIAALFSMLAARAPLCAQNGPRIALVDDTNRVRLISSTHRFVASSIDQERLDPNSRLERMVLVLGPSDAPKASLNAFLDNLHDKGSSNYHRWLTPEQFGERFGPSQSDLTKIAAWLQQLGFDHVKIAPGRSHIEFSGRVQTVEKTFRTEMHSYLRRGETHIANNADVAIPRALAGVARGVNLQNLSFSKPALTDAMAVQRDSGSP